MTGKGEAAGEAGKPEIRILADADALTQAAAEEFAGRAEEVARDGGAFTVALSGGSTPPGWVRTAIRPPSSRAHPLSTSGSVSWSPSGSKSSGPIGSR